MTDDELLELVKLRLKSSKEFNLDLKKHIKRVWCYKCPEGPYQRYGLYKYFIFDEQKCAQALKEIINDNTD